MTIEEAKIHKNQVEAKIGEILQEFAAASGLSVADVNIHTIDVSDFLKRHTLYNVDIVVEI